MREPEEIESFAVGHIAFGYISGKASARLLKTGLNIPLVATLAIIPDVDILFQKYVSNAIEHRGPTHSVVTTLIVFIPFFIVYRKAAVPYFVALVQHSLVGDYIAGGKVQLFWPLTNEYYGAPIAISILTNIAIEWSMFLLSIAIMSVAEDMSAFTKAHKSNLILAIPTFTVLLPAILSYPLDVPVLLIPPHIVYTIMFLSAILLEFHHVSRTRNRQVITTLRRGKDG